MCDFGAASARTRKDAPGPRGYPVLGVLPEVWQNPLWFFVNAALEHGDVVCLRMGFHRVYLISHPKQIKDVLQDNHHNYRKSGRIKTISPLFGEGLATREGDLWRRQRDLIQPAFDPQQIASLATIMTDATAAMLERWRTVTEHGRPLHITTEMTRLTRTSSSKRCLAQTSGVRLMR
ncbi:MAG: cytochrome P450 [Candidatus Methylomirabilia bacterium]